MHRTSWYKKNVTLTWQGHRLTFGVAQELFSSHEVDSGSRLLLRSLEPAAFAEAGQAVDFGCGYGVLGVAWAAAKPEWSVTLIDRDTLAVEFAFLNSGQLPFPQVEGVVGIGLDAVQTGVDLILWNVPGKAGEPVIEALTRDAVATLNEGGVLALVIVNPLADLIRATLIEDQAASIVVDETYADHTVIHARHVGDAVLPGDPFDRGVFDREPVEFGVDAFDYEITPVVGLPEYDSYSFATEVVFDMLRTVTDEMKTVMVVRPGQGHVPLVAANMLLPERLLVADRDFLALRASVRALEAILPEEVVVMGEPAIDLNEFEPLGPFDLVVLMLEDQVRNELHQARLADLATLVPRGGQVVVGGTSATVSRFLSFAAKAKGWKERSRTRRSGASAARIERIG